jgi:hypothetical protein
VDPKAGANVNQIEKKFEQFLWHSRLLALAASLYLMGKSHKPPHV